MRKVVFDVETTGVDVNKDRIVQLAIALYDGERLISSGKMLVNPEMRIPKEATEIHGITDAMVRNAPTFKQLAKKLKGTFENKILMGYNILRFDLPLLLNEFDRAGVDIELSDKIIDVYRIERSIAPKTLSRAYRKYTGKNLESAHDALADVKATAAVYRGQQRMIRRSDKNVYQLSESEGIVDFGNQVVKNERGDLVFNFGKHKGKRLKDEKEYCQWILKSDFPNQLKKIIKKEIK